MEKPCRVVGLFETISIRSGKVFHGLRPRRNQEIQGFSISPSVENFLDFSLWRCRRKSDGKTLDFVWGENERWIVRLPEPYGSLQPCRGGAKHRAPPFGLLKFVRMQRVVEGADPYRIVESQTVCIIFFVLLFQKTYERNGNPQTPLGSFFAYFLFKDLRTIWRLTNPFWKFLCLLSFQRK